MKNLILETKILTELNRMKEIMGLSLITEGVGDDLLKLLGFDSKSIDNMVKSGFDVNDLSKLSNEFSNLNIKTIDDFKRVVSSLDDAGRFTNNALTKFVNNNPTLMDEIADVVSKQSADYAKNIIATASLSTLLSTRSTKLNNVLSMDAFEGAEENVIAQIDLQLKSIDTLIDDIQNNKVRGFTEVPEELVEVRDSLSGKKSDVKNLKNKRSTSTGVNDVNKPSGLGNILNSDAKIETVIRGFEVDPIFKRLNKDMQEHIRDFIRQEMKDGKTGKQLSSEVNEKITTYLQNMLKSKQITQEQYDTLIRRGSKLWPGWKIALLAFVILAPTTAALYAKGWFKDFWKAITDEETGKYEDSLDGFKKFVNTEVQATGYTPDEIDGDYVLKPNGYDEDPNYYKDYLQKFKYEDGTFKQ